MSLCKKKTSKNNLKKLLIDSFNTNHSRIALCINGNRYSYNDIFLLALKISKALKKENTKANRPIGIYSNNSLLAYGSILCCLLLKRPFVYLDPNYPTKRLINIIDQCSPQYIISEFPTLPNSLIREFYELNPKFIEDITVYTEIASSIEKFSANICYIKFTSGSSGVPKGVPITTENVESFLYSASKIIFIKTKDRVIQTFNLSFDLSIGTILLTWSKGASLYVTQIKDLADITNFIKKNKITIWFSVPTTLGLILNENYKKNNLLSTLRLSMFCGEPLQTYAVKKWKQLAPKAKILNLYGPTEATIFCFHHYYNSMDNIFPVVPIGKPFDSIEVDMAKNGELLLSGSQVFTNYIENISKKIFYKKNKKQFYRTGDIVEMKNDVFHFKGRLDSQVKIRGYRIELLEITNALLSIGCLFANTQIKKSKKNDPEIISTVVSNISENDIRIKLSLLLPKYMLPDKIYCSNQLISNRSGKSDWASMKLFCLKEKF